MLYFTVYLKTKGENLSQNQLISDPQFDAKIANSKSKHTVGATSVLFLSIDYRTQNNPQAPVPHTLTKIETHTHTHAHTHTIKF